MKVFLSPAKNMRAAAAALPDMTAPRYLQQAEALAAALRAKAPFELESILQTSPAIARRRSTRTGQTRAAYPRFWRMMGWPINIWRRKRSRRQNCGSRRTACGCFPRFTVRCGRSTQSAPTGLSWRTGWMGAACTSSGAVRFTTICSVRVKRWSTSPQMNTARRCGAICRQATGW